MDRGTDFGWLGNSFLRFVGQTVKSCGDGVEKVSLQFRTRVGEREKPRQMRIPIAASDARERAAARKIQQVLAQAVAVQRQGFKLVAETQQTFVARSQTRWPLVVASRVEVTAFQRLDSEPRRNGSPPGVSRGSEVPRRTRLRSLRRFLILRVPRLFPEEIRVPVGLFANRSAAPITEVKTIRNSRSGVIHTPLLRDLSPPTSKTAYGPEANVIRSSSHHL